ncbi:acyltransferase family protein [Collinsella sp. LCP19S3_C9]|uniref:acyltransferase family protein n=1 Tax=Collinsella sp. LCP19S3_C9 TaxID=3438760 RepID=UPI003F8D9C89
MTAIQGLRAISFLAIFVSHSNLGSFGCLGAWGVSVFLMLSGFLMAYQYLQKPSDLVFGLRFAWNKVKSLYPLHLVTMVAKIPVAIFDVLTGTLSLVAFVVAVILNVGMAQIWVPWQAMYSALNGPSWFMCVIAFSYFLFLLLLKQLKRLRSVKDAILFMGGFVAVYLIAAIFAYILKESGATAGVVQWCTYYFPPVRFCDFGIGCALGWMFLNVDKSSLRWLSGSNGGAQLICFGLILLSMWAYTNEAPLFGSMPIRYSILFLPTTAALIWLVSSCSGKVERVWSCGWLTWIAALSPYAFLIHAVVLKYVGKAFTVVLPMDPKVFVAIFALAVTLTLSACWKSFDKACKAKHA